MPNVADTNMAPASMITSQRWRSDDGNMIWLILTESNNDGVYAHHVQMAPMNIVSLIPDQQQNKLFIQQPHSLDLRSPAGIIHVDQQFLTLKFLTLNKRMKPTIIEHT